MFYSAVTSILFPLLLVGQCAKAQQDVQSPLLAEGSEAECHNACTSLLNELGSVVHYGSSTEIKGFAEGYYSLFQMEVLPACVITPRNAQEVAQSIQIIRQHSCIFAVKSGGHAQFAGASNAASGITIDLRLLNEVEYLGAKDWDGTPVNVKGKGKDQWTGEITRVGTGNRWERVYKTLEPLGVSVVGGRMSGVGVGGFILGGGISFISRRYGWALDNVRNFEVVLANGTLTNVNHASSPDLYFALRGGGNNFGIVTRFDLETHPQGLAWGGYNFWLPSPAEISLRKSRLSLPPASSPFTFANLTHLPTLFASLAKLVIRGVCAMGYCVDLKTLMKAFEDVVTAEQGDPYAQTYVSFAYASEIDSYLTAGTLVYSKPVENPKVFDALRNVKPVYSKNRMGNFTDIYKQVDDWNEAGYRQEWAAVAFRVGPRTAELFSGIFDIVIEETERIKQVKDVLPCAVFQPINRDEIKLFSKNGGNCLGIKPGEGPLILFSTAFRWSREKDNLLMRTANNNVISRAVALAKTMDLDHRYIYQNYANSSQDVFGGYGEENRKRLREIQRRFDPDGVFSRLQPGYFKI